MYQNFFIYSSVDGHLGCFHVLAIVNSAAMNNEIHMSFSILVSSGYMPRSGIAGSYGGFIPVFFKGISIMSAIVAISIYIPLSVVSFIIFSHSEGCLFTLLSWENFLEKEMVTHSIILAWKVP